MLNAYSNKYRDHSGTGYSSPMKKQLQCPAAAKSLQSCPTLWQPMRLPRPWDSPGKNTGVASSFSNAWKWKVKVKSLSRVRLFVTPWMQPTRLLRPWDFPGKSTGVGCHCLLRLSNIAKSKLICPQIKSDSLIKVLLRPGRPRGGLLSQILPRRFKWIPPFLRSTEHLEIPAPVRRWPS